MVLTVFISVSLRNQCPVASDRCIISKCNGLAVEMCQFEYLQLRDFEQRGALKQKLHCKNGHFGPKVQTLEGIELQRV